MHACMHACTTHILSPSLSFSLSFSLSLSLFHASCIHACLPTNILTYRQRGVCVCV